MGRPNQDVFAQTLMELAAQDRDVVVVTSDSRGSGRLTAFGEQFPAQIVEIGIAEQDLVGVAAGLASMGKKVFAVSPACFLTARALEQIKNDVAYSDHPVTLVGISAGVSYGALGTTHHSLHDLAALQAIHNIDIVAPADNFETRAAVLAAARHPRPLYLRFGKQAMPVCTGGAAHFEIGKARQLTPSRAEYAVTYIACGEMVPAAYLAGQALAAKHGLPCCVLSLHSIRPLDEAAILEAAQRSRVVITVEEHSIYGGLGGLVAEILSEASPRRVVRFGIEDRWGESVPNDYLLDLFQMSPPRLSERIKKVVG
jgi:transketolase